MPKHFLDNIDLNQSQILNARLQLLASDPTTAGLEEAQIWYNSTAGVIKFYDGTLIHALGTTTGVDANTLEGQGGAYYLNRSNHSGTQLASTISDLASAITSNAAVVANSSARHSAVTLGTANGLALSGQELTLALATNSENGALSSAQFTKLQGIETGAQVNTVDSVNSQTGDVSLDTDDVGEGSSNLYYTETRVTNNSSVSANTSARHAAVTLGTANGLSLSG
jgi:hypothetical protein